MTKELMTIPEHTEEKLEQIFEYIADHEESSQKVFFDGQIYDAFSLLADLIAQAESELILIDNYVDIHTLNLLAKKRQGVRVCIYTTRRTTLSKMDIDRFNSQYPQLEVRYTEAFHDRFLVLDQICAYHIGASVKDAGKKCFGINRIEDKKILRNILQRVMSGRGAAEKLPAEKTRKSEKKK